MSAAEQPSLLARARRGGLWVLGGRVGEAGLRFVSNVVMAALLFPEAFGVMALVNLFLMGLQLFSDTGVGPSIVRSGRGEDPVFLRTAFTVQLIRGGVLALLCWVLAGPYALLYGQPELATLVPIAGLTAILNGCRTPNWFLADRRLAQGRKVLVNLLAQVLGIATMIAWAAVSPTIMSLVGGSLVTAGTHAVLGHLLLPGPRAGVQLDRAALRELFGFGRWIFLSTALTFLAMQADRLFLGYVLPMGVLGVYAIARRHVELVAALLRNVSTTVVFPAWTESLRENSGAHAGRVLRSRRGLLALGMAGMVGVIAVAPPLFRHLYDPEYADAALYAQLLCVPGWFQVLRSTASSALLAYGDSRSLSFGNLVTLLVRVPGCVGGWYLGGVPGFIIGTALGDLAGLACLHVALLAHGCDLRGQELRATAQAAGLGAIAVFVSRVAVDADVALPPAVLELVAATLLAGLAAYPARALIGGPRR